MGRAVPSEATGSPLQTHRRKGCTLAANAIDLLISIFPTFDGIQLGATPTIIIYVERKGLTTTEPKYCCTSNCPGCLSVICFDVRVEHLRLSHAYFFFEKYTSSHVIFWFFRRQNITHEYRTNTPSPRALGMVEHGGWDSCENFIDVLRPSNLWLE